MTWPAGCAVTPYGQQLAWEVSTHSLEETHPEFAKFRCGTVVAVSSKSSIDGVDKPDAATGLAPR